MKKQLLSKILSLILTTGLFAESSPIAQNESSESVSSNWIGEGIYELVDSNSTLSVPSEHTALFGENAKMVVNQMGLNSNNVEAVIVSDSHPYIFSHFSVGYISDDLAMTNSNAILRAAKKSALLRNKNLIQRGLKPFYIRNWIQKPIFDHNDKTIHMAIETVEEDQEYVYFYIFKLGRVGFEQLLCITEKNSWKKALENLERLSQSHSFNPGFQYSDYCSGDKIGGLSSNLVMSSMGVSLDNKIPLYTFLISLGALTATVGWILFRFKFPKKIPKSEVSLTFC